MNKGSFGRIAGFCGACIAFYIGAGFATMQEVMQYEASYGRRFWIVLLVAAAVYIYTNLSFANNGSRYSLKKGGDIYKVYCGKYIGRFYDCFSAFFCYMCFIVMCSSANSTASEQWGLPKGAGAAILASAVVITALFGLDGIVNALGKLGPVIIGLILLVSVVSLVKAWDQLPAGFAAIDASAYDIKQVGGNKPFLSGMSYGGFVILWFASFLAEIGARNDIREVNIGMSISSVAIFSVSAVCCLALIANIAEIWSYDVPALALASRISPVLALVFAVVIFCGLYTTALPLLWTSVSKLAEDGTARYRKLIVIGGITGFAAGFLPYKTLVNVLYGLNGYLGFILIAFMLSHDILTHLSIRNMPDNKMHGGNDAEKAVHDDQTNQKDKRGIA